MSRAPGPPALVIARAAGGQPGCVPCCRAGGCRLSVPGRSCRATRHRWCSSTAAPVRLEGNITVHITVHQIRIYFKYYGEGACGGTGHQRLRRCHVLPYTTYISISNNGMKETRSRRCSSTRLQQHQAALLHRRSRASGGRLTSYDGRPRATRGRKRRPLATAGLQAETVPRRRPRAPSARAERPGGPDMQRAAGGRERAGDSTSWARPRGPRRGLGACTGPTARGTMQGGSRRRPPRTRPGLQRGIAGDDSEGTAGPPGRDRPAGSSVSALARGSGSEPEVCARGISGCIHPSESESLAQW